MVTQDDEPKEMGKAGLESRRKLPRELHPAYDMLVAEYKFHARIQYNTRMYPPKVLAELVKAGWRPGPEGKEPS